MLMPQYFSNSFIIRLLMMTNNQNWVFKYWFTTNSMLMQYVFLMMYIILTQCPCVRVRLLFTIVRILLVNPYENSKSLRSTFLVIEFFIGDITRNKIHVNVICCILVSWFESTISIAIRIDKDSHVDMKEFLCRQTSKRIARSNHLERFVEVVDNLCDSEIDYHWQLETF